MNREEAIDSAVCETYEKLLEECEAARRNWNEQRAAIFELGLRGKEMDDELLCLQARFAKANALACSHLRDCQQCESARRAGHAGGAEGHGHGGSSVRLPLSSFLAFLVPGRHTRT